MREKGKESGEADPSIPPNAPAGLFEVFTAHLGSSLFNSVGLVEVVYSRVYW